MFILILIWKKWSSYFLWKWHKGKTTTPLKEFLCSQSHECSWNRIFHLPEALKTKSKDSLLPNTETKGGLLDENAMTRAFPSYIYYCAAELMDILLTFSRELIHKWKWKYFNHEWLYYSFILSEMYNWYLLMWVLKLHKREGEEKVKYF